MAQVFASAIDADRCDVDCLHPDAIRPILGRSLGGDGSRAVADLFATLADSSRARILHLLAVSERELCVCDMALVLGMSVSALSHQLHGSGPVGEGSAISRLLEGGGGEGLLQGSQDMEHRISATPDCVAGYKELPVIPVKTESKFPEDSSF